MALPQLIVIQPAVKHVQATASDVDPGAPLFCVIRSIAIASKVLAEILSGVPSEIMSDVLSDRHQAHPLLVPVWTCLLWRAIFIDDGERSSFAVGCASSNINDLS